MTQAPLSDGLRALFAGLGVALLAIAAAANFTDALINVVGGRVIVTAGSGELVFPAWWVLVGLPILLGYLGLMFPVFRHALAAPWQDRRTALPFGLGLFVLLFTLWPWEFPNTPGYDSGSSLILSLLLTTSGFTLLLAGLYRNLGGLERNGRRVYDWLLALSPGRFMLLCFGFVLIVTNVIAAVVFEHMPHIQDSIAQLFHARIFASGRLFLDSPRFAEFFDYTHIINNGRWYSQYPPFHSVLLMFGVLAGIPWFINPLLGALTAPAVYLLGRELYDEKIGRRAGLLTCLSPFVLNMASEFMNHTSTLLFMTLFMVFFFRTIRTGGWHRSLLAGLFLGIATGIRPYTVLALLVPFAVYVYLLTRDLNDVLRRFVPFLAALLLMVGMMLLYNWIVNGEPLLFGYVVKWGRGHEVGFGKSGWGAMHTPLRGLVNTGNNLNGLNRYLLEWPIPILMPVIALFVTGIADRRDWLLAAGFLGLVGAYFLYWYQDLCFGPRFLFEGMSCLIVLLARSPEAFEPLLRRVLRLDITPGSVDRFLARAIPLILLVTLVVGIPPLYLRKYSSYYNVDRSTQRRVRERQLSNALVFCRQFGDGFSSNSLTLDGPIVYTQNYGWLNPVLTRAYPDRSVHFAEKESLFEPEEIEFEGSEVQAALDGMARALPLIPDPDYRTVIWPFVDLPPESMPRLGPRTQFTDFRLVTNELFASTHVIDDYLPALACWLFEDPRGHAWAFGLMNKRQNFILAGVRCTALYETPDSLGIVYDLRRATGEEFIREVIDER